MHINHANLGQPSISIVIPVYNEELQLGACLEAIARQTVAPFEVIVVDNNSTDHSMEIAATYPFVRIIKEARHGIVFARNAGFNAASGDLLARIDADTRLQPNWVELLDRYMQDHPDLAAVTGKCYFRAIPLPRFFSAWHASIYYGTQRLIAGTQILWGSNMAIRRRFWLAVQDDCLLRNDVDEDIDLSLHMGRRGFKIRYYRGLRATVSLLHGKISPKQITRYVSSWPRNYSANKMLIRAGCIWIIIGVGLWILILLSFLVRVKPED